MHKNTAYFYHLQLNLNFLLDFISKYIKHFQTCGLSDFIIINKVIVLKCVKLASTRTVFLNSICMNILFHQWLCLIHLLLNIHHLKHCLFLETDDTKNETSFVTRMFSVFMKKLLYVTLPWTICIQHTTTCCRLFLQQGHCTIRKESLMLISSTDITAIFHNSSVMT